LNTQAQSRSELLTVDHPAFNTNTVLVTEPIKELYQTVRHILMVRETGCCFTAHSGVGKTKALTLLEHILRERIPELVVITYNSWNQQVPSIRAFFKHFLTAVGHPELRGETFDLRHRLVCRLIDLARTYKSPFVVLLIDEASSMRLEDFLFLKDVYNDLDRDGVGLVTIMMGQDPDFSDVIANLRQRGRSDLVSRFARRRETFRALANKEDIAGIFRQYDSATWPAGSAQTWTQFFMPHAWDAGFRLEEQTPLFFDAVKTCSSQSTHKLGFPARQFFTALRRFLTVQQYNDAPAAVPGAGAWEEALEFALFADAVSEMKNETKRVARAAK
jgi:hypothetical protein